MFFQKFDFSFFGISGRLSSSWHISFNSHDYAAAAALRLVRIAVDGLFGRALEYELDVLVVERGALDMRDGFDLLGNLVALRFSENNINFKLNFKARFDLRSLFLTSGHFACVIFNKLKTAGVQNHLEMFFVKPKLLT